MHFLARFPVRLTRSQTAVGVIRAKEPAKDFAFPRAAVLRLCAKNATVKWLDGFATLW
jgi:hypothetical protein